MGGEVSGIRTRVRRNENARCSDKNLRHQGKDAIAMAMASAPLHALCYDFPLLSCKKRQSWDRCCSNISKVPSFPMLNAQCSMALACVGGVARKCKWLSLRLSPAGKTNSTHTGPIQIGPSRAWRVIHLFAVDLCRSLDVIGDHDAQTTSRLAERIDPS